jgi:LruC domain-containing protein
MKRIILFLMLTIINYSCVKPNFDDDYVSVTEPFGKIIIPANFDWKTSKTLNVSIVLPNNGTIQSLVIKNSDGTKIYFKGYPDDGSRTVKTIITIPSYETNVKLSYSGFNDANLELGRNSSLSYNFNMLNKSTSSFTSKIALGSIADFVLYTGTGALSSAGTSDVTGNIGTNSGAITGFNHPILKGIIHNSNATTTKAAIDLTNIITQIENTATTNTTHAPAFGSETLTPGVYKIGGASSIAGTLILDAKGDSNALFIFKIGGAFTTGAGAKVVLVNGASSENIFWLANGAISMAASTSISGNLIANPGAVSMGDGGELNGRMLSVTGAVSLYNSRSSIIIPSYSGTLAFEDLWPSKGDYDFNDLVVDYNFMIIKNNKEMVKSITATFVLKAYGASVNSGFGFTLPTLKSSDILSVTGYDVVNKTVFDIGSNGLENGQSKPTIIVFDNAHRIMPSMGGMGANTQLASAYTKPVTIVVKITLSENANIKFSKLDVGSVNPFMIVGTSVNGAPGSRGKEIHLANYEPSDLFDRSYFGKGYDRSSPSKGRYFVTGNNHPFAIDISDNFEWTIENEEINDAHYKFLDWALSGGSTYKDWHLNKVGYRNNDLIYSKKN